MRFLFYDCVKSIEKGKSIVGVKTFPLSEEFLGRHYSRKAATPGVILIEVMAQLIGWLAIYSHDFELSAILSMVEGVKVPPSLPPGATAEVHGEIVSTSKRDTLGRGWILVNGEEVARIDRIIFVHFAGVPREELKRRFAYYGGFRGRESEMAPEPVLTDGERRVVVTGLGMVTPLGVGSRKNWRRALAGESGIRRCDLIAAGNLPAPFVGQVPPEDWEAMLAGFPGDPAAEERRTIFALQAAEEALADALLTAECPLGPRAGVALAAGLGNVRLEDVALGLNDHGEPQPDLLSAAVERIRPDSILSATAEAPAARVARRFGALGVNLTVTSACAAATQALGAAFRAIRRGDSDLMLAGGADAMINPIGAVFFVLLGAASTSKKEPGECKPFDRRRSGLIMGEGAGVVVLESEERARARGARIYAEVAGYGASFDSFRITAPNPEGTGAARAMTEAVADAGLAPEDVDYINAHGTGTKLNDPSETVAVKKAFGEHAARLAVSSTKSMIGHLIGACGGPEFIFTVLAARHDKVHPTIGLTQPDPKCDLDYVTEGAREMTVRAALSASFGFGGQNAAIVVRKYVE